MPGDYDNNMTGTLFKNDKKTADTPTHPDYKGHCEIDGVEYWQSAWIKKAKNDGKTFMSFSYTKKDDASVSRRTASKKKQEPEEEPPPF